MKRLLFFIMMIISMFQPLLSQKAIIPRNIQHRFIGDRLEITYRIDEEGTYQVMFMLRQLRLGITPKNIEGIDEVTGGPFMKIVWFFEEDGYSRKIIDQSIQDYGFAIIVVPIKEWNPPGTENQQGSSDSDPLNFDNLRKHVVKIGNLESSSNVGTGFYVSKDKGTLYFLTAEHNLIGMRDNIPITFWGGQETFGTVVNTNSDLDIAIINCPKPHLWNVNSPLKFGIESIQIRGAVITIGHPYNADWDVNFRSHIKEMRIDPDDRIFSITPEGIMPGCSGGPVLSQEGRVLGMMLSVNSIKCEVLSANTIDKFLQEVYIPGY